MLKCTNWRKSMEIYPDAIRDLPAAEKMLLLQHIWDDLSSSSEAVPLPRWTLEEAARRREEMRADPSCGRSHTEVWSRISEWRNG